MARRGNGNGSVLATLALTDLKNVIGKVAAGLPRTTGSCSALGNLCVEFKDERLIVRSTDLEQSVSASCVLQSLVGLGQALVSGRQFAAVVRDLQGEQIELSLTNAALVGKCGSTRFSCKLGAGDFPAFPTLQNPTVMTLAGQLFRTTIRRAIGAVDEDQNRSFLNGVNFTAGRAAATDGHRLAYISFPFGTDGLSASVPRRVLKDLMPHIADDQTVELSFTDTAIQFKAGHDVWASRLIVEKFPDVERIMPTTFKTEVEVEREPFAQAVKRVATMVNERTRSIEVTVKGTNILSLFASNPNDGETSDSLEVAVKGEPIKLCLNADYLLDALRSFTAERVTVSMLDRTTPVQIAAAADEGYRHIIMPLRG